MSSEKARKALRRHANPKSRPILQSFFKTGKGQYAEGDVFIGVKVPKTREVAKQFKHLSFPELQKLLRSKIHEERLLAVCILVDQFRAKDEEQRKAIYDFYFKQRKGINNWDLVDSSAPQIVGEYLTNRNRAILHRLAKSKDLWERRIAIVATQSLIRKGLFDDTLKICERLLKDEHDLIHKACGWMLREVGAKDRVVLVKFLDKHAKTMPRTMLRYSIEHMSAKQRKHYRTL